MVITMIPVTMTETCSDSVMCNTRLSFSVLFGTVLSETLELV